MFLEPYSRTSQTGWMEVICGCMFSGKTEELIRRLKRARIANMKVQIFKPATDTRYDKEKIVSHDENFIQSQPVTKSELILNELDGIEVVGIDEAQFFDENIVNVCHQLAARGIRVIVAGLDMDYLGRPFGPMPLLLSQAEYITKVHAICVKCGNLASYSFRKSSETGTVLLGEKQHYEPRCRACFLDGMKS
jgi:thymidine kinase